MGLHLAKRKLQSGGKSSGSNTKVKIPGRLQLQADAITEIGGRADCFLRQRMQAFNGSVKRIKTLESPG
jgi:hypothetical protein